MKNLYITLFLGLFCTLGFSQSDSTLVSFPKNEFKLNAIGLLAGFPEITYERILNDESSLGISFGAAINNDSETRFTATPYYRLFFGKGNAKGFFVEGFGMLNSLKIQEDSYFSYDPNTGNYISDEGESYTDFALGLGIGAKWISKRGVVFEINGGIGRNLLNSDKNDYYDHTFVGRGGFSLGYRF
ncbi:MAG: hypothetical protein ACI9XR_002573 [Flavobacterium sp.]|jgi:hypothetical protein